MIRPMSIKIILMRIRMLSELISTLICNNYIENLPYDEVCASLSASAAAQFLDFLIRQCAIQYMHTSL